MSKKKFDAEILAKVWWYELLDILAFLEKAVKYELLVDLSKEDNFYEFKDKRIISAIKSFFSLNADNNTDDVNEALNSVEKSYDYSKVSLLFRCRELIKDSKQIIKKSTEYKNFIKKLKIK